MGMEEQKLMPFREALEAQRERELYDRRKWIYVPDFYAEYRYILGTVGKRPLIVIGINPSTAEPGKLDNTLKSVDRIVTGNGFDSFVMFNVYAQRATDPGQMDREINLALHRENMEAFRWILENSGERPAIWAAWGTIIEKRSYLMECLLEMISISDSYQAVWYQVGKRSRKGHPHHPLYLKKDSKIEVFDVRSYLDQQRTSPAFKR
ncbi:MAG: DUF1643 domain-containing protein [Eubacteriales bacterium]|nr:DUF1643 domain-containing protein [Eubacteriales bacterium]